MKKKVEKLKAMDMKELTKKLADLQEDIRSLRFKAEGSKSKNVKEPRTLRKEVARVLTFIKQRKQNAQ